MIVDNRRVSPMSVFTFDLVKSMTHCDVGRRRPRVHSAPNLVIKTPAHRATFPGLLVATAPRSRNTTTRRVNAAVARVHARREPVYLVERSRACPGVVPDTYKHVLHKAPCYQHVIRGVSPPAI
jgi:hypothetical protein